MNQNKIWDILSLPKDIQSAVNSVISGKTVQNAAKNAYSGEAPDFPLCKRKPLTRLATVILLLCKKYDEYTSIGVPEEIIADTFRDVSLRAILYKNKTGKTGISKDDVIWFRHIINHNIFKIGVLQFQPFNMVYLDEDLLNEPYMIFSFEQKNILPPGTPVINCHIQNGTDLTAENVLQSLERAKEIFKTLFPKTEFKAFLCYSWLLYPDMINMMNKTSKIRNFANLFKIIGKVQDNEQAFEYLFEKAYKKPPRKMCKTTLQNLAKNNPKLFGFACGIINL